MVNGTMVAMFLPEDWAEFPVLRESAIEIDELMQKVQTEEDDYTLTVFEVSEEQAMVYALNRLKDY